MAILARMSKCVLVWTNTVCLVGGLATIGVSAYIDVSKQWGGFFENPDPSHRYSVMNIFIITGVCVILVAGTGLYGTLKRTTGKFALKCYLVTIMLAWICQIFGTILIHNVPDALRDVRDREFISADYTTYELDMMTYIEATTDQIYKNGGCSMTSAGAKTIVCPEAEWFKNFVQSRCESHGLGLELFLAEKTSALCTSSDINCMCRAAVTTALGEYARSLYECVASFTGVMAVMILCTCYLVCCYSMTRTQENMASKRSFGQLKQHPQKNVHSQPPGYVTSQP